MTRVRKLFTAPILILLLVGIPVLAEVVSDIAQDTGFTRHDLAYYLDDNLVNFVRPGLNLKITSASIQNNKITVTFTLTDPKGLPLDRSGVNTPGPVTTSFIGAYIPQGQTQYVDYATRTAANKVTGGTVIQAATDSGGTYSSTVDGTYTYTFGTTLPANFDQTATHTVGMTARRDLTEFGLIRYVSNDVVSFVPNGSAVTVVRDVVQTANCNQCHNPLAAHGGSRIDTRICVLCHTPQSTDGNTGNTVDFKVMIHKIHMGEDLPSVKAGQPYKVANGDFSTVAFPSDVRRCNTCHQNATQGPNFMTKPTRTACGSCHDDVDFPSGKNHAGGPQVSDKYCATCHFPQGELEFDASILGAHVVPTESTQLPGVVASIVKIDNAAPGQKPTITFTVKDKQGNPTDITKMNSLRITMVGPTTDYAVRVQDDVRKATASGNSYIWTMSTAIAADASGSYAFGMEGYNYVTINQGTVKEQVVRDVIFNPVAYASVDGSPVRQRRKVVALDNCNKCHGRLFLHGGNRSNTEYCVFCHNPTGVDRQNPPESINFKTMIHKIHTGEELQTTFTIGNSNFNEVRFPGDRRDCEKCHAKGTEELPLPDGLLSQQAPRDYINPMPPISGACLSCHTQKSAAAHASIMTSPTLGESCEACHGTSSDASIDRVHAR